MEIEKIQQLARRLGKPNGLKLNDSVPSHLIVLGPKRVFAEYVIYLFHSLFDMS